MINSKINYSNYAAKFLFVLAIIFINCFTITLAATPPVHREQTVADSTPLKAFEGIYRSKDDEFSYFRVTAGTGNLVAKSVDGDRQFTLTRKSELTFETKDGDGDETIAVIFAKSDAGEITQALIGDREIWLRVKNYVPVKKIELTAAQLKAFEGKYQFEEKNDAFLLITATATGLKLTQPWDNKEIDFVARTDVDFFNKEIGFPLKFTKDKDGNVIKVLAFNRDMWDKVKE